MTGKWHILQLICLMSVGYFSVKIAIFTVTSGRPNLMMVRHDSDRIELDVVRIINGSVIAPFDFVQFDPVRSKKVVVLTYQRCGSSFFGQLFNKNKDAFYMYEPLDALYAALYGVQEGWNVPSDITTYTNGTARLIPERELKAVSSFLKNMLSCQLAGLPTESLIHRFWFLFRGFHESLSNYTKCLRNNKLTYTTCAHFTPGLCGTRFGQKDEARLQLCNDLLWNKGLRLGRDDVLARNISRYRDCIDGIRTKVDAKCSNQFRYTCEKSKLRSVKTVRATMASMDALLASDSNIRVIHLIRDPRAVVLSRRNFDSSGRSKYAGGSMARESEVYCRDVVRDVRSRRILDQKYPGRILPIIYEDLTRQPTAYAKKIYEFMNATISEHMMGWFIKNTQEKNNSTEIANKWQTKLTYQTAKQIAENCKEFFQEVKYRFS